MNASQLLKHFDRLAEAPDAVARLRRFILDLAVRGKLVEQDAEDEPALELLRKISTEKKRRVSEGSLREQKVALPIDENDSEHKLPHGWEWTRMSDVIKLWNGFAFKSGDFTSDGIPVIRIGDLQNGEVTLPGAVCVTELVASSVSSEVWIPEDALLIAMSGATTGKVAVNNTGRRVLLNQRVGRIEVFLANRNFVRFFFETIIAKNLSISFGTAIPNLSAQQINDTVIALPPLAEQHRIVAKVDELMALCDQLEAAQQERERRRDRLAAASLQRLNQPAAEATPEELREHARFHLNHLPRLITRPGQIKAMRHMILDMLINGRLSVPNNSDESANSLLSRIEAEKRQLLGEGVLKPEKPVQLRNGKKALAPQLNAWAAVCLQDVCISITDGDHLPPPQTASGVPFLVIGNVRNQVVDFGWCRYVAEDYYQELADIRKPRQGDILYTLVGSYGIPVIVRNNERFCVQRHIGILRPSKHMNVEFLARVLKSGLVFGQATECATGIAQKTVPLSGLRAIRIPLPPLAEQHRIVAKVDELMALCDQLEAQLTITQTDSRRLLEAVLA